MRGFFAAAFFFDDVLAKLAGFGEKAAVNYFERFVVLGVAHGFVVLSVCSARLVEIHILAFAREGVKSLRDVEWAGRLAGRSLVREQRRGEFGRRVVVGRVWAGMD